MSMSIQVDVNEYKKQKRAMAELQQNPNVIVVNPYTPLISLPLADFNPKGCKNINKINGFMKELFNSDCKIIVDVHHNLDFNLELNVVVEENKQRFTFNELPLFYRFWLCIYVIAVYLPNKTIVLEKTRLMKQYQSKFDYLCQLGINIIHVKY